MKILDAGGTMIDPIDEKHTMKYLFILAITCITLNAAAQIRKIPAAVTDAFKVKFPKADKVEWKDNLTNFEADFTQNDHAMEAKFNGKGEWLATETVYEFENLPLAVREGFKKSKYTEWEVTGVKMIEEDGKKVMYRLLVRKTGLEKRYLFFDASGKLVKSPITI